jgi:hypothetical protein
LVSVKFGRDGKHYPVKLQSGSADDDDFVTPDEADGAIVAIAKRVADKIPART